MTPFDFIGAVTEKKNTDIIKEPHATKEYKKLAFIINRGLAYFYDTVLYANEMNQRSNIPPEWQFSYLLNIITKKKRFSKWESKLPKSDDLEMVMRYYGYSKRKAITALTVLTDEQLAMIKQKFEKGGRI